MADKIKAILYFGLSILFIHAFYTRYYKWIDCFNEKGRCYDPIAQQVLTTGGLFWIVPGVVFLLLCLRRILTILKNRH